jgi:hypothetical protein
LASSAPPPDFRLNQPADRFMELHADPSYLADARKLGLCVSPVDGAAVQDLIRRMAATQREMIEPYKNIMSR